MIIKLSSFSKKPSSVLVVSLRFQVSLLARCAACAVALTSLLTTQNLGAAVIAEFTGGNSTSVVDAYNGMAGNGWTNGWQTNALKGTTFSATTSSSAPVNSGGTYLSVFHKKETSNQSLGTVNRSLDSSVLSLTTGAIKFSFDFRIDDKSITSSNSFVFFANAGVATVSPGDTTAWSLQMEAGSWNTYDGITQTRLSAPKAEAGDTYHFDIIADPLSNSFTLGITNLTKNITWNSTTSYAFRNKGKGVGNTFSIMSVDLSSDSGVVHAFSLDNFSAASAIPEPKMNAFMGLLFFTVACFFRKKYEKVF